MLQFVTPANEHQALGQALSLCSISPSYVDSELGLVVPRVFAAAQAKRILFLRDTDTNAVVAFATFAFLDPLSAAQWSLQTRAPGVPDFQRADGICFVIDYVFEGSQAKQFADKITEIYKVKTVTAVKRKVTVDTFTLVTLGGANV